MFHNIYGNEYIIMAYTDRMVHQHLNYPSFTDIGLCRHPTEMRLIGLRTEPSTDRNASACPIGQR